LVGNRDEGWTGEFALLYGKHLFFAMMRVNSNGLTEMLSDASIAEGLPIKVEKLVGHRVRLFNTTTINNFLGCET